MFKVIFSTLVFVATTSNAMPPPLPVCSCTQTFEDFQGYQTEITVHVTCPTPVKNDIECTGEVSHSKFSATCSSIQTGEKAVTSSELDPWSHPAFGYADCRVN